MRRSMLEDQVEHLQARIMPVKEQKHERSRNSDFIWRGTN